ncbi:efflux RND transporter permease subunit [Sediminispirochaeta bajacaliforniensis]|uniref:efflux RND transporter permease subunit n=1 Tax=Sediminispirochaeta bajacaliforniensis TaxID=148 RepID=UPI000375B0B0|nr:efflux RND transporter permease subunit [Sediminispirochaeta bajacaliforniensis]
MHIVDISIKRPVLTITLIAAFIVFGILAYLRISVSLFPDIKAPYVTIQTVYPGASPQVIESQITERIEDQISAIANLESITSYSMDSVSLVTVEFTYGKDENLALQEVKDKVEVIISELPDDAERPAISKVDIASSMPVMNIVLEGDMTPTELYTYASTTGSSGLAQVSGVGSVEVSGGQEREIHVELDRTATFSRSIPLTQIVSMLAAANVELPGGSLKMNKEDFPVRFKGEFNELDAIRDLDVESGVGTFKLRQLADVVDSHAEVKERTVLFDKKDNIRNDNALLIQIIKNPTANTIDVVDGVMKRIKSLEAESSGRVSFKVVKEDASFVRDTVNDTLSNVYLGILFTGLVLLIFLHDLRSMLIVAISMPFSIISTFLIMNAMGISLNILSLMGLSSATGTLVANSVVVLENIFRYKELGHNRLESASRGTKEVMMAVFASTLTNIAVFVPLANMSGTMGATLSNFAYTIVIATLFSIFVSFTLTPLMASRMLPEKVKKEGRIGSFLENFFTSWERFYAATLRVILKNRFRSALVVAATIALFMFALSKGSGVNFELMPTTDGGKIGINVELPQGSELESTATTLKAIEDRLAEYPEVETLLTTLGSTGSLDQDVNLARMEVFLNPKSERSASNSAIAARAIRDLADIPGAEIRVSPISEISVDAAGSPIDLYLRGSDTDTLLDLAERMREAITQVPGTMNTMLSSKQGKTEIIFEPDRKRIAADGLTVQSVAMSLRMAVDGYVATTYKTGGEEYDVRVMLKDSELLDIEDLKNIPVVSAGGVKPLSRYADIYFSNGYNQIMRTDKVRTIEISAGLLPGYSQGAVLNQVMAAVGAIDLPAGYSVRAAGTSESLNDTVTDLVTVFFIAIILTYMLLSAILESFVQPLFILATVPLSIIGIIGASLATGAVLNFVAMLGVIMLIGIVVNNAILILDYYNQLKRSGKSSHDALIEACPTKLKPILMSNIAIILGMLPMALGIGASGAEMRQPMGIVIIGGIISSTLMTLWVIPSLELLLSRHHLKSKRVKE